MEAAGNRVDKGEHDVRAGAGAERVDLLGQCTDARDDEVVASGFQETTNGPAASLPWFLMATVTVAVSPWWGELGETVTFVIVRSAVEPWTAMAD